MTKEALMRAKEIEEEVEYISEEILPSLNEIYEDLLGYKKKGKSKIDGLFWFSRFSLNGWDREATFTLENTINFVKTEIRIITEHKQTLEKELKEL